MTELTIGVVGESVTDIAEAVKHLVDSDPAVTAAARIVGVVQQLREGDDAELAVLHPSAELVRAREAAGNAARDWALRRPGSDWVLCMDADVRLEPGALSCLAKFAAANPQCPDLLQGVVLDSGRAYDGLSPVWRDGRFGVPTASVSPASSDSGPAEIAMQDLGLFACRARAWPGLSPRLRGIAAHEGYLHKKFRAAGARTLLLPGLRWSRETRPGAEAPDPQGALADYLWQRAQCGLPVEDVIAHFGGLIGPRAVDEVVADWERERANPFSAFDAIVCLNLDSRPQRWQAVLSRFKRLGIGDRVVRLPAVHTPENHNVGCALSHRKALQYADERGLDNILVLEDDVVFLSGATWVLRRSLRELRDRPWNIFYLGAFHRRLGDTQAFRRVAGCAHLEHAENCTCAHALAFHRRVIGRLLDELPATQDEMADLIAANGFIDIVYGRVAAAYRTVPVVAGQESFVPIESPDLRDCFEFEPDETRVRRPSDIEVTVVASGSVGRPDPSDPRLHGLRRRYQATHLPLVPLNYQAWNRDGRRAIDFTRFRGDTQRLVTRDEPLQLEEIDGRDADLAYAAYVRHADTDGLLEHMREDGAFGARTFTDRGRTVSPEMLDSASELAFLSRAGALASSHGLAILDIGAGYGRLAHRACESLPGLARYTCVDAVPEATYLSEQYLRFREVLGAAAEVVALDELDCLGARRFDLAVAVHSLTQMSYAAATFWIDLLRQLAVPRLFVVPEQLTYLYAIDAGYQCKKDFSGYLRDSGYHLVRDEPAITHQPTRVLTGRYHHFLLYSR